MNQAEKIDRQTAITIVGIIVMLLLTATKVVPSSQIAGYSVFVGIAFFFIVEAIQKPKHDESGLRFGTFWSDLRKSGALLWAFPVASAILTLIVGHLLFGRAFVDHIVGRTSAILSFERIPLLIGQVIIAALGEEIAFRGFFVGKAMKRFPFWLCTVVSSVAFAAGHIAVGNAGLVAYDIATVFIDSMIYAVVYRRSGNCLMSTISHTLCNAVAIAATLLFF